MAATSSHHPLTERLASGTSVDSTARGWSADTGQIIGILNGYDDWVESAVFSPDGLRVLTASRDKTARIWDVFRMDGDLIDRAKQTIRRCLTGDQRKKVFLDPEPPYWCIETAKWPYDTNDWKA